MQYYGRFEGLPVNTRTDLFRGRSQDNALELDSPMSTDTSMLEEGRVKPFLLDLIPIFISLTARRGANDQHWRNTAAWMELAAEMMLQAALEQYRSCGKGGIEALLEAFAWGVEGMTEYAGEEQDSQGDPVDLEDDSAINLVFLNEHESIDAEEVSPTWAEMRKQYLEYFLPPDAVLDDEERAPQSSIAEASAWQAQEHFEDLANRHPIAVFERNMLGFLDALCESYERPVLFQLEDRTGSVQIGGKDLDAKTMGILRTMVNGRT